MDDEPDASKESHGFGEAEKDEGPDAKRRRLALEESKEKELSAAAGEPMQISGSDGEPEPAGNVLGQAKADEVEAQAHNFILQ